MASIHTLRLVGAPETNKVMMGELSRLSRRARGEVPAKPTKVGRSILTYPFSPELARVAVWYHRTSSRVLWDLYVSRASRLEPLYDEIKADVVADERRWCGPDASISVSVRNVGAFAAGERQLVGTIKNALVDGAAQRGVSLRVAPRDPDLHVTVRMQDDQITVSLDLAGTAMSHRGYRREGGAAPIREHAAAALVMLARYDSRSDVFVDPMCGSGTLPIEAALMARATPLWVPPKRPVLDRIPALAALEDAELPLFADATPVVIANELDRTTLAGARRNAQAAGVADDIDFMQGDFRDLSRARIDELVAARGRTLTGGVILCNPPYGERLPDYELQELYQDLAEWARQFTGWRVCLIATDSIVDETFGRPRIKKPMRNGPLRANFYLYDM